MCQKNFKVRSGGINWISGYVQYVGMSMIHKKEILKTAFNQGPGLRTYQMIGFVLFVVLVRICLRKNKELLKFVALSRL